MIPSKPVVPKNQENPEDESTEHEWAEYNLPPGFLVGRRAMEDDDQLAFLGFSMEQDGEFPEGSS
jgi:hypothetical protein